jgi:hypothetical protein
MVSERRSPAVVIPGSLEFIDLFWAAMRKGNAGGGCAWEMHMGDTHVMRNDIIRCGGFGSLM